MCVVTPPSSSAGASPLLLSHVELCAAAKLGCVDEVVQLAAARPHAKQHLLKVCHELEGDLTDSARLVRTAHAYTILYTLITYSHTKHA